LKKALVIQGGGFKTGFSAGVLQAFLSQQYNPFDIYVGVSGGAIALSYFLSGKEHACIEAMLHLTDDNRFLNYKHLLSSKPVMDVDFFREIAEELTPFDIDHALKQIEGKTMGIVMTSAETGKPHYHLPSRESWIDALIASSSMPLVTKGAHLIGEKGFIDGAWSDALPVKWAIDQGATDILIVRTTKAEEKAKQHWLDYFGQLLHWRKKEIQEMFKNNHLQFNASLEFIANPPAGISITQIAPEQELSAQQHSNSSALIKKDYEIGCKIGLEFLSKRKAE